jgi:FkbM family methyltransferase
MTDISRLLPDFLFGFNAYFPEDIKFLASLCAPPAEPDPNLIIDFFGMLIDPDYEPNHKPRRGEVIKRVPFPTDTILSEGIEYAALAQSLLHADQSFDLIELGAGWGPWVSRGVICARRLQKKRIAICAVEADPARFGALRRHLALNRILPEAASNKGIEGDLEWHLHNAIAWVDSKGASWPLGGLGDAGRRATPFQERFSHDWHTKSKRENFISLDSIPLSDLIQNHQKVDLLHMDVQGTEVELIASALTSLNQKVRLLFVGTHSRLIEGQICAILLAEGWALLREEPCLLRAGTGSGVLEEMTVRDGGQLWVNPRLVSNYKTSQRL